MQTSHSPWITRLFARAGLDLTPFYIPVKRLRGDLIGEPAHLVVAIVAIVCQVIAEAPHSIGLILLVVATALRAPALIPSWKQMFAETWVKLLLLWIIWTGISIAWSPDRAMGFHHWTVLKFFLFLPCLWPLSRHWRWLLAGVLLAGIILQAIQFAGACGATYNGKTLKTGFLHESSTGIWDAITFSCWIFLAVAAGWTSMLLCIPFSIFAAIGVIWANQRVSIYGLAVEILIANIVLVMAVRGWIKRMLIRLVLSCIIITGVYLIFGDTLTSKFERLADQTKQSLTGEGVAEERMAMWGMTLTAWKQNQIIGCGNGGYKITTAPIDAPFVDAIDIHSYDAPHSTYLMILLENGIVGLALFLSWTAIFFFRAFRRVQSDPIRIGAFGGAVIWFVAASVDTYHIRTYFLVIGVIMIALASMSLPTKASTD